MKIILSDGQIKFHSAEITREELEKMIEDLVKQELPGTKIKGIKYTEDGIEVETDECEISIDIDWDEISIKEDKI